jgi:hypothetical protein
MEAALQTCATPSVTRQVAFSACLTAAIKHAPAHLQSALKTIISQEEEVPQTKEEFAIMACSRLRLCGKPVQEIWSFIERHCSSGDVPSQLPTSPPSTRQHHTEVRVQCHKGTTVATTTPHEGPAFASSGKRKRAWDTVPCKTDSTSVSILNPVGESPPHCQTLTLHF